MPTSVLLAVLAAAGLLALAPALTRRYDDPEPVAVKRAMSTARVLSRRRRRRTVPGARPVNPPRYRHPAGMASRPRRAPAPSSSVPSSPARTPPARTPLARKRARYAPPRRRRRVSTAMHRRRRVLVALVLLNLVELAGVVLVGPGFWIGFSVSFSVLLADLVYLRGRAVVAARRRRVLRRRQAWIAAQQAAVRREHDRRAADRVAARRSGAGRSQLTSDGAKRGADSAKRRGDLGEMRVL